ncbi:hypothetical protein NON00_23875, partial [Roseomonas sp. GC11]|nr:hypothetical protein [Roseomonas sp. GC11]
MSIPTPPRQTRRLHAGLKWGSLGWGKPDWGKPDWGKPDWGSPVWPLAAAALLGPFVAVLQSKAMAPLALVVLVAVLGMARRRQGRWPLPSGAALWAGLALAGWGMLSGLWSPGPLRALHAGLTLGGLMLLAGAAGRAVAAEPGAPRLLG